jgi:hypothetical protein
MAPVTTFHEAVYRSKAIRDLGLTIAGSSLESILMEFQAEIRRVGLGKIEPRFYLSTEWGVPDGTVAIAIPFYLARPDLTALHAERGGYVEGTNRSDILRYLRHELGHVVNYAYQLYDTPEWIEQFGAITQPYVEEYRPEPFSRRFVHHLPGWYAQKHPDEDWAETFAVWMTPGLDWRAEYRDWPGALAKLCYCDRTVQGLRSREPLLLVDNLDEDVSEINYTLEHYYGLQPPFDPPPPGLEGSLRSIFADLGAPGGGLDPDSRRPASQLVESLESQLASAIFRWTGHFPETSRHLLRHLAQRAGELKLTYPASREAEAVVGLTCLATTLAMNYVRTGSYVGT